jgi:eukaryotic-like serine/threonine-protein kinase
VIETTSDKRDFLTGAPLTGDLLANKLRLDLLPPQDALRYAIDIGNALSRAHDAGRVHGAVSPYSIVISGSGAALAAPGSSSAEIAAAYRSPEQVLGQTPDWRSDIFSFGALLYEMVNGDPAFTGEGEQLDTAIVECTPPPLLPRSPIHTAMAGVISGCLDRDPARRRQRIQNAVIELKLAGQTLPRIAAARQRSVAAAIPGPAVPNGAGVEPAAPVPFAPTFGVQPEVKKPVLRPPYSRAAYQAPKSGVRTRFWVLAGIVLLACAATLAAVVFLPERNSAPVYRFSVEPQDAKYPGMPAISPDGRYLTWSASGPNGKRMLWVQGLDAIHAKPVADTDGAGAPFWSPDSHYIGFFANQSLKKLHIVDGNPNGAPQIVCPAESLAGGGAWNQDGNILFAPGLSGGLSRVAAGGGKPVPLTKLDAAKFERSHLWPQFLPDGKHFVFFVLTDMGETTGVYTGTLDSPGYTRLFSSETNAVYAAAARTITSKSGYLLFIRNNDLMGQPFNPAKLQTTDDAIPLATGVGPVESFSLAQISVSDTGVLVYQSAGKPTRQLVWMDRSGKTLSTVGEPSNWGPPRVSPDGQHVAVGKPDPITEKAVVWLLDAQGHASQFSELPGSGSVAPVWSPDGTRIAFGNDQLGAFDLYVQPVAGQGKAELVYRTAFAKHPDDWTHDGKFILFSEIKPGMSSGVWALSLPERKAEAIVDTIHYEGYAALSPDGKWLAYQSDEGGTDAVYVQPFDNGVPGTKKLSTIAVGGGLPRWRRDGGELYFMTQPGRIYAVAVHPNGGDFAFDPPRELFHTRPSPKSWNLYDVSADGQRFLLNVPMEWPSWSPITVTTSWTKVLQQ